MDTKFLQTLAFVAWVQQQTAKEFSAKNVNILELVLSVRLRTIYNAAQSGNHREYLRLVAGCPYEFKNRVFVDNAPDNWQVTGGSKPSNQSRYWHEVSSH